MLWNGSAGSESIVFLLHIPMPYKRVRFIFLNAQPFSFITSICAKTILFMKKRYWFVSFAILSVLFFQCQKDVSFIGGSDTGVPVTPDPVTASIQGNITDENDLPAAGVAVTAGASMAITDANGYFHITNASLDKNTSLVTAEKDGYFKGYRLLAATSGCNQIAIKLIKKDLAGTIASAAGGEASLSSGAKISLPSNGVVIASSNSAYSGDIKVYASYINPKSSDISKTVPGSFVANDKNGKRVTLSSYGMLAVELSSASGEKLQIKNGSVATLTIPIPSASIASAPVTIPLWYIDEATGIWQEDGSATKQGSNYVGEVKHFSFWNCDQPFDAAQLSLTLHTTSDQPVVFGTVKIIAADTTNFSSTAFGYTDSLGQVQGMVPTHTNLTLEVFSNCGTIVYTQSIPAINSNTDLGVIKVDFGSSVLTFQGVLLNCNNQPVTNGYVIVNFGYETRYVATDATGKFSSIYFLCSPTFPTSTVVGVDNDSQQQGDPATVNVSFPLTDAGTINACGTSVNEYINYTLDGTDYTIDNNNTSDPNRDSLINGYLLNGVFTSINGLDSQTGNSISFTVADANATGTYPLHSLAARSNDSAVLTQPFNITLTKYPAVAGEFFEGNFSGSYIQGTSSHTISATFRARRNY